MWFRIIMVLTVLATPVSSAEADSPCNLGDQMMFQTVAELFDGPWDVHNLGGFTVIDGRVAAIPGSNVAEPTLITVSDEGRNIVMSSSNIEEPIQIEWAEEALWVFEGAEVEGVPDPVMSIEDQQILTGCPNNELARLVGTTQEMLGEEPNTVTYRMMILGEDIIHGFIQTSGTFGGKSILGYVEISLTR